MLYKEMKAQLERWLSEMRLWGDREAETFRFIEHEEGRGRVVFCTAAHSYHLSFTDTYLGCTASCRIQRPGENWTRGSDLSDGKFCRDTFDAIMRDIMGYELIKFTPIVDPVAEVATADVD